MTEIETPALGSKVRIFDWLESNGKRVGIPILILSFLSFCIAVAGLCIGISNYWLQIEGNRPNLVSDGGLMYVNVPPAVVHLNWNNIGKKEVRRGTATLFTMPREKIGSALIGGLNRNAGTNVLPGQYGETAFQFDTQKVSKQFLVCATYFDLTGRAYEQAFLFRAAITQSDQPIPLEELPPPDIKECR
jgi:hypothetical protein